MEPIGKVIKKIVEERNLGNQERIQNEVLREPQIQLFLRKHQDQLNSAIVKNSMTNLYEYYSQLHKPNQVLKGYRPELFMNGKVIDVRYTPTEQKIENDHERAVKKNLKLIDLPKRLHDVKFSELDVDENRAVALNEMNSFLKKYKQDPHQRGLYLTGNFGVGKTYMLAGLANQITSMNRQVIFLHVPTFIASLSSHFNDNTLQDEIRKISDCDVLILDDIGAESLSQWSRDDVLGVILQARMDNVLPTFFSTNFDFEKLEAHFAETRNAIDPVKAARLMQRVKFLAKEVVVSGEDRRKF